MQGTGKGGGGGGGKGAGGFQRIGGGGGPRPSDWGCHICGVSDNRDWRERCRNCQSYRNVDLQQRLVKSNGRPAPIAERQLQQQRSASQQQQHQQQQQKRKEDAERRKLREEVEKLQAELAAAKSQQSAEGEGDGDECGDEMDESGAYATWTEDERAKRLELAKGGLAYSLERFGDDAEQVASLRDEIAALQKASREAKPFKAHRDQLERRRERLRRQQERDEEAIIKTQAEIAELQSKKDTLQAAIDERAKTIKEVTEELNELVRKSLAEEAENGDSEGLAWSQAGSPWAAMEAAIKGLAEVPGIPTEFSTMLAHVQNAAATLAASAAAAQAQQAAASPPPAGAPAADAKSKPPAPTTPVSLAPQGRFSKAATKAGPSPTRPQHPPPPAVKSQEDGSKVEDGSGSSSSSKANPAPAGGAASARREDADGAANESEAEMEEETNGAGGAMSIEIESSLAKLPEHDQRRLRDALRRGGGRDTNGDAGDGAEEGDGRRERERSPRPTKLNDKEL